MSQKKWKRVRRERRAQCRQMIEWLTDHKPKWWRFRARRLWKWSPNYWQKEVAKL